MERSGSGKKADVTSSLPNARLAALADLGVFGRSGSADLEATDEE